MWWFALKACHVLFATLYLGTGLGSAYYKLRAFASRDVHVIAFVDAEIVRADYWFTVPSAVAMPASGFAMVYLVGMPLNTSWVLAGLGLYAVAGLCWLWAARLQLKMRTLSAQALARGVSVLDNPEYLAAQKVWTLLGAPAFLAAAATIYVMVAKPSF